MQFRIHLNIDIFEIILYLQTNSYQLKTKNINSTTFITTINNSFHDGELGRKGRGVSKNSSTSFSLVTSTNVGIIPKNFLTFPFNPFATLVSNFKFVPRASPKLLCLNQDHPSKKCFFRSNSYKIQVMITSLIEMLELPNFGHMKTSIIQFESGDKILLVTSWTNIMTS